jgi:hypothetical protein
MTNINESGDYPLEDENDFKGFQAEKFERLWREEFSLIPPLDKMPATLRDKLKEYSWKVYMSSVIDMNNEIQKIANNAYYDGVEDSTKETDKKILAVAENLRDILKDIEK